MFLDKPADAGEEEPQNQKQLMVYAEKLTSKLRRKEKDIRQQQHSKKCRLGLFTTNMEELSDEMVIFPLKRYSELTPLQAHFAIFAINEMSGIRSFNQKIVNIRFDDIMIDILFHTKEKQSKEILIIGLGNLVYFFDEYSSKLIDRGVTDFLLKQIESISVHQENDCAFLVNLFTLFKNILTANGKKEFLDSLIEKELLATVVTHLMEMPAQFKHHAMSIGRTLLNTVKLIISFQFHDADILAKCFWMATQTESYAEHFDTRDVCSVLKAFYRYETEFAIQDDQFERYSERLIDMIDISSHRNDDTIIRAIIDLIESNYYYMSQDQFAYVLTSCDLFIVSTIINPYTKTLPILLTFIENAFYYFQSPLYLNQAYRVGTQDKSFPEVVIGTLEEKLSDMKSNPEEIFLNVLYKFADRNAWGVSIAIMCSNQLLNILCEHFKNWRSRSASVIARICTIFEKMMLDATLGEQVYGLLMDKGVGQVMEEMVVEGGGEFSDVGRYAMEIFGKFAK